MNRRNFLFTSFGLVSTPLWANAFPKNPYTTEMLLGMGELPMYKETIWNRKYKANKAQGLSPEQNIKKIIEYSTLPGTSRHHWGTDVDIIDGSKPKVGDVLVAEKFHNKGPYTELKKWMDQNAKKFGFYLPYTKNLNRKGFYYEPWHYSYAPLSISLLKSYTSLDLNKVLITEGLEGSAHLNSEFISTYYKENILGIAAELKNF